MRRSPLFAVACAAFAIVARGQTVPDSSTWQLTKTIADPALEGAIIPILPSSEPDILFLGCKAGAVRWNVATGNAEASLKVPTVSADRLILAFDLSPDGKSLLVLPVANPVTRVVDPKTLQERSSLIPAHRFGAMHPGPTGMGVDRWVWADQGAHAATVGETNPDGPGKPILRALENNQSTIGKAGPYADVLPTGKAGVALSPLPDTPRLVMAFWNAANGEELARMDIADAAGVTKNEIGGGRPSRFAPAFSADNRIMLMAIDGTLHLYRAPEKDLGVLNAPIQHAGTARVEGREILRVALHPDGHHLAVLLKPDPNHPESDLALGEITGTNLSALLPASTVHKPESLAFSPDGKSLYLGNQDGTVTIYQPKTP